MLFFREYFSSVCRTLNRRSDRRSIGPSVRQSILCPMNPRFTANFWTIPTHEKKKQKNTDNKYLYNRENKIADRSSKRIWSLVMYFFFSFLSFFLDLFPGDFFLGFSPFCLRGGNPSSQITFRLLAFGIHRPKNQPTAKNGPVPTFNHSLLTIMLSTILL